MVLLAEIKDTGEGIGLKGKVAFTMNPSQPGLFFVGSSSFNY